MLSLLSFLRPLCALAGHAQECNGLWLTVPESRSLFASRAYSGGTSLFEAMDRVFEQWSVDNHAKKRSQLIQDLNTKLGAAETEEEQEAIIDEFIRKVATLDGPSLSSRGEALKGSIIR